jgi:hypothetical protein
MVVDGLMMIVDVLGDARDAEVGDASSHSPLEEALRGPAGHWERMYLPVWPEDEWIT